MFSEQGILLSEAWGICQEDQWAKEEEKCGQGKSIPESGFCPPMLLAALGGSRHTFKTLFFSCLWFFPT